MGEERWCRKRDGGFFFFFFLEMSQVCKKGGHQSRRCIQHGAEYAQWKFCHIAFLSRSFLMYYSATSLIKSWLIKRSPHHSHLNEQISHPSSYSPYPLSSPNIPPSPPASSHSTPYLSRNFSTCNTPLRRHRCRYSHSRCPLALGCHFGSQVHRFLGICLRR